MFTCYDGNGEQLNKLYQWDLNRTVFVSENDAPDNPVFHFCCAGDKKALVVTPQSAEGGFTASVPNVLLQRPETICLYLVGVSGTQAATENMAAIPVEPRAKPEDYVYPDDSQQTSLSALSARLEAEVAALQTQLNTTAGAAQTHAGSTNNPHGVTAAQVGARPAAWMPGAADVGADPSGTAASAVATHNTAADAHSDLRAEVAAKAGKSTIVTATLAAASWAGDAAPYTYALSVTGVTTTSNQEILPAADITAAQLSALQGANITDGGQASGSITLKAWGEKPTMDLPIRIIKRGDM